jgi:beta-lactam-binding protein with PASTA domain
VPVEGPGFVGKPVHDAVDRAHRLGLEVQVERRATLQPRGIVVRQLPPQGTLWNPDDPVILTVSKGPATEEGSSPPSSEGPEEGHGEGKGHGKGKAKGHEKHGEGD